jgi:putative membrane protein
MFMAPFFAFLHHLAAFALVAALAIELVLVRDTLTLANARKLMRADMIYGIAAGVVLLVGLGRLFHLEKGATYYLHSWTFLAKFTLFVIVGLVSIVPTIEFFSWRRAVGRGELPDVSAQKLRSLRTIIHLELVGIVLIILCAALMAKGVGSML